MTRVLIAYGTSEGHAARIAEYMAGVIREHGQDPYLVDVGRTTPDPRAYDAVIVGASIHRGRHQTCVGEYVREVRECLERMPNAFYSVSLSMGDGSEDGRRAAEGYVEEFRRLTRWQPGRVGLFAGALAWTKYNVLLRWVMQRIAREKGGLDLDTTRDYVYTDWGSVRRFTEEFLETACRPDFAGMSYTLS